MKYLKKLGAVENLELAFLRLQTAQNHQYKRYYRDIFSNYSLALKPNVKDLSDRLLGGSYSPSEPYRIYTPKPTGLQRPITLLTLEDNIVYQGIANLFAQQLSERRRPLEYRYVFSNIQNRTQDEIFFLRRWPDGYSRMRDRIGSFINEGRRWMAYCDLAAFYDTISHLLLLKTMAPRSENTDFGRLFFKCLSQWSAVRASSYKHHGIPQGPLASNFLADCFMMPIDKLLSKQFSYVRYVDDIRLFGKTESEVREGVLILDRLCSERGIIPQSKKFRIELIREVDEVLEDTPSLSPSEWLDDTPYLLRAATGKRMMRQSVAGKPLAITNKSKARFVLFRSEPSRALTSLAVRLLPRHPEHIEAFLAYFRRCVRSQRINDACKQVLQSSPYDYVKGEALSFLVDSLLPLDALDLRRSAIRIAKDHTRSFNLRLAACRLLCRAENLTRRRYADFVMYQEESMLLALVVPYLPRRCYSERSYLLEWFRRKSSEPGLMLAQSLVHYSLAPRHWNVHADNLPRPVRNVYASLGLVTGDIGPVDPIGEILSERFRIENSDVWFGILGSNYDRAKSLLRLADSKYDTNYSGWLSEINSFNDVLLRAMLDQFLICGLPGGLKTKKTDNELQPLGNLLQEGNPLARAHPILFKGFSNAHNRRSISPSAHAYEAKTGKPSKPVKKKERNELAKKLAASYDYIIKSAPSWGLTRIGGQFFWQTPQVLPRIEAKGSKAVTSIKPQRKD